MRMTLLSPVCYSSVEVAVIQASKSFVCTCHIVAALPPLVIVAASRQVLGSYPVSVHVEVVRDLLRVALLGQVARLRRAVAVHDDAHELQELRFRQRFGPCILEF